MNHLQNLIDNATAILAARQELIDNNWVAYRDVDSETQGFPILLPRKVMIDLRSILLL